MDTVRAMIDQDIAAAETAIAAFVRALGQHPANALAWSGSAFTAAADLDVLGQVRRLLHKGQSVSDVRQHAQREVNRLAGRGSSSTQVPQNLMRDEIMSAWARALLILSAGDKL